MKKESKIDNLLVLVICQSDTSVILSSDANRPVVHGSTSVTGTCTIAPNCAG